MGSIFPPTLNDAVDVLSSPRDDQVPDHRVTMRSDFMGMASCVETHWFGLGEEPAKSD
jgi:hypothetical protein